MGYGYSQHKARYLINLSYAVVFAAITALLFGCASDPLTRALKKCGYAPVMPTPATMHIGDIYGTKGLIDPLVFMRDNLFDYIEKIMEKAEDDASIPDTSSERQFNIGVEADIIGEAKAELSVYRIAKFKVRFGGVVQYIISKTKFEDEIYRKIREIYPIRNFDKKYVITALLKVSTLEYEFYDKDGGKISIAPGSEIEKVLKAKLSAEWSASKNNNLFISSPRYIGYRMAQLNEKSYKVEKGMQAPKVELIDIPAEELRKALK